jgi:very-short-patch-repair endonuclease
VSNNQPNHVHLARSLRRNQTDAEQLLWYKLRGRQAYNFKFRRQFPIVPYIADFCCEEAKLIIELDGGQHAETVPDDAKRTAFFERRGYKVVRFWNNDVLTNIDGVLEVIAQTLLERSERSGI